jgi:GT2 family glycosyltransferase
MAKDQTDKIQTSDVKLYKKNLISNEEMNGNGAVRVKVTVIVVNYNGKKYLESCFDSLLNMDRDNISLEIIMVDNLSQDDSVNYIRCKYPTIKVIENDLNNFARALNLGVRNASGDYVAFLNNDTRVEKNWLRGLLDVMLQDEKVGAVQSKIFFEGGKINSVGVEERADFNYGDIGFCEEDYGQYEEVKEINSFSGGSVLLRRSCLESVGSIDEEFMMFFEDTDFSTRCKKTGWKIFYSPMSVVYHMYHGVASSELANYFCSRNRLLYLAKHFPTRLPKSIKTSSFYLNGEHDDLYQTLIQAIKKLIDNNASEESLKVMEELKDIIIEIYGNEKACDLFQQVEALIGIRKIKMGICDHLVQFTDDDLLQASSLIQSPSFYLSHNTDLMYMAATLDKPVIAVFNQVSDVVKQLQKYKIELDDVSCRLKASKADQEASLGVIQNMEERLIKQEETYQLHLQAILTSSSWRLTAPFRRLAIFLRRIRKAI